MSLLHRPPCDPAQRVSDAIQDNLDKVSQFEKRQDAKRTHTQRVVEKISLFFGSVHFFKWFLGLSAGWIALNYLLHGVGYAYWDAPPFPIMFNVVTYVGVLIAMAVLVRQNRLAQVEESRSHLELQVNLLAEQKTTKIIALLEELRRDLPMVSNRHDEHATTLQTITNPDDLLEVIESRRDDMGDAPGDA